MAEIKWNYEETEGKKLFVRRFGDRLQFCNDKDFAGEILGDIHVTLPLHCMWTLEAEAGTVYEVSRFEISKKKVQPPSVVDVAVRTAKLLSDLGYHEHAEELRAAILREQEKKNPKHQNQFPPVET